MWGSTPISESNYSGTDITPGYVARAISFIFTNIFADCIAIAQLLKIVKIF